MSFLSCHSSEPCYTLFLQIWSRILPALPWTRRRVALALGLSMIACGTDEFTHNPELPIDQTTAYLRPGDSLQVQLLSIPDREDLTVQVDDRGYISLRYIGSVKAAGHTVSELSQEIRRTYLEKKIYIDVDVAVIISERFVYVGGEVARPGRVQWSPDLTLSNAVKSAGGFSIYAKKSSVLLSRDQRTYPIDAKLAEREPQEDPKLLPGDSISVPRSPY